MGHVSEFGRSVADVAHDLEISEQSIYTWRRQDRIDRGPLAGRGEKAELTAAKKRIAELAVSRRAVELLREEVRPKGGRGGRGDGSRAPADSTRLPRARRLQVGYYEGRNRAPSQRAIRHAWLTDLIRQIHLDSGRTYGSRRVHAELRLGHGIEVGTARWRC